VEGEFEIGVNRARFFPDKSGFEILQELSDGFFTWIINNM
jgi:hypothetical protein